MAKAKHLLIDNTIFSDLNIAKLEKKFGPAGFRHWFALLTVMHTNGGEIEMSDLEYVASSKGVTVELLRDIVFYCIEIGLFKTNGGRFWSERMVTDLSQYEMKISKSSLGGKKSGETRRIKAKIANVSENRSGLQSILQTPVQPTPKNEVDFEVYRHISLGTKAQELQSLPGSEFPVQKGNAHLHPVGSGLASPNPPQRGVSAHADNPPVLVTPSSNENAEEKLTIEKVIEAEKEKSDSKYENMLLGAERDALVAEMARRLGRVNFSDTKEFRKKNGANLLQLKNKIGDLEFWLRLEDIASDDYTRENTHSLSFCYRMINSQVVSRETIYRANGILLKYLFADARPKFDPEFEKILDPRNPEHKSFVESEMNKTNDLCAERIARMEKEFGYLRIEYENFGRPMEEMPSWSLDISYTKKLYDALCSEGITYGLPFWKYHPRKLSETIDVINENKNAFLKRMAISSV